MHADDTADQHGPGGDSGAARRRPYLVVGVVLLGVVAAVLIGAFLLDHQLHPRVGIESVPTLAVIAQGTPIPTVEHSVTALPVGTIPTAVPAATAPVGTPESPELRVATSPLEREIESIYYRYLQVYSDAVLNLDASRLAEVLDGRALQLVTEEVNELKANGTPVKIIEDDRVIAFGRVTDMSATLIDEYTSRSVYVDPNTHQPLPRTGAPTRIRQSYEFRKISGVWKVVDGTRQVLGEASR